MNILDKVKQAALTMQRYSWEQGVLAQAFLESGEPRAAILMAQEAARRQISDGRCAQIGAACAVTDPCAIGEVMIVACEQTGDPELMKARDRLLRWALHDAPRNEHGIVYHLDDCEEIWVDSFYMLPPFLARVGYFDEALRQVDGYWALLLDADKSLLSHRWDDGAKRFARKDAWGVGNGWAAAGMARVIALLPQEYAQAKECLVHRVKMLLDAALPLLRPDGLFHDVLDDAQTFPEINCGQMLAYTIYRGVKDGWLAEKYIQAAERIRAAAMKCVDEWGIVRPVCGAPHFDAPGAATEGQAFFILMESARQDWTETRRK